ncbi:MAG: hypothetical protein ABI990_03930 [Actinomycetota bacterium]
MENELISREEVVGLLFTVSDISQTLTEIKLLLEDDDGEETDES